MDRKSKKIPNLFIVGAPKCGTTSLAHYLGEHPDIFMCERKEPNYFARHLSTEYQSNQINNFEKYLNLFNTAHNVNIIGEASTRYLRSKKALLEIKSRNRNAKIVAMLRNPVDLVYSWHKQKLYENQEIITDFKKAWHLQFERENGKYLPSKLWAKDALFYAKIGNLGTQVENLLRIFGKEQVHLILFDDFITIPQKVYTDVLAFLNVSDDGRFKFPAKNRQKNIRNQKIYALILALLENQHLRRLKNRLENIVDADFGRAKGYIDKILISEKATERTLSYEFKKELIDYFYDEIKNLEILLGKKLEAWYQF